MSTSTITQQPENQPLLRALRLVHDAAIASPHFQRGIAESVGRLHLEPEPEAPRTVDDERNAVDLIGALMDRFGPEDVLRWARFSAMARGVKVCE